MNVYIQYTHLYVCVYICIYFAAWVHKKWLLGDNKLYNNNYIVISFISRIMPYHPVVISFCPQPCFTFTLTGHVETSNNDAPLEDSDHRRCFLSEPSPNNSSDPHPPQSLSPPVSWIPLSHNQVPGWVVSSPNWTHGGFNGGPTGSPSSPVSCAQSLWSPCWRPRVAPGLTAPNWPASSPL